MFRQLRRRTSVALAVVTVLPIGFVTSPAGAAPAPRPVVRGAAARSAIPGDYLVVLKSRDSVAPRAGALAARYGGTVGHVWEHALHGFSMTMTAAQAGTVAADPGVAYVEQDQRRVTAGLGGAATSVAAPAAAQTPVTWALDRIDQHALPLDNHYAYDDSAGQGVNAVIMSTGIQAGHPDLGGRVVAGANFVPDGRNALTDCHGAGTRTAGVVGGTQYGVAKKVSFVSVRVADCHNLSTTTEIVNGYDWIIANVARPAVVVDLLLDYCLDPQTGAPAPCAPDVAETLVNAQEEVFAAGFPVFGDAGSSGADACANSNGAAPDTVYVGAIGQSDARSPASNFGPCVTMYAPGQNITTDDPATGTGVFSDEAFAAAFVAGAAALFAGKPEFAGASPTEIRDELVLNRSTPNVVTGLGANSNNRLLFTGPPGFFTEGDSTAMTTTGTGPLELYGVNAAGSIFHRDQVPGTDTWTAWIRSATRGWKSVSAAANADGRIELVGLAPPGDIWARATNADGTWSNWSPLDRPDTSPVTQVAMAYNHSNRLEVIATNRAGGVFYRSQTSPGARTWTRWTGLTATGPLRRIVAMANADGRIEILALDDAGRLWHSAQGSANDNNWSAFSLLDGFGMANIAVARNDNGTLELVGVDAGGTAWRRGQTSPGAVTWTAWSALPPRTLSAVTIGTGSGGRLRIVGVDNLGAVWAATQTAAGATTYSAWSPLDGQLRP